MTDNANISNMLINEWKRHSQNTPPKDIVWTGDEDKIAEVYSKLIGGQHSGLTVGEIGELLIDTYEAFCKGEKSFIELGAIHRLYDERCKQAGVKCDVTF